MSLFAKGRAAGPEPKRWGTALDAALKISGIASSGAPLPEVVQAVVRAAVEVLGAEQSSIMLLDETGKFLVLTSSAGLDTGVPLGYRVRLGDGIAGHVLATGRPLRLEDVDPKAFVNFVPKGRKITSSLVIPLRVNGMAVGVLNLAICDGKPPFTEDDRRLAQMFADQAAGVIQRTKLHEQAERRSSGLAMLVECTKGLVGTLDLETLLHAILDGVTRLAGQKNGFVCLFDPERGSVSRGVFRGMDKGDVKPLMERPEALQAIETASIVPFEINGNLFVAMGIRSSQGTRGLIVVPGGKDLLDERGYVLTAFAHQCESAVGAAELHGIVERKESQLSSLILSVPNPIILVDADRRIVSMNPSAEQLFEVSSTFTIGTPVSGALSNPDIEEFLRSEGYQTGEVEIGVPARNFKVRAADVRVPGAPIGRLLVMDDITHEREMVQRQRDFVAMIGHELRTPLTVVKGFARMMLRRIDSVTMEESLEALNTIDQKAAQLERLIEDLLYVSKIESREATLKLENHDVKELVRRVTAEVLDEHPGREVKLEFSELLAWPCDETKVSLVIRHLLDNALKYSEGPDPVIIRGTHVEDEIQIDVVDKGPGIVSSDLPHVFDRFRQLDGSSTRKHGGTGVGLYLCAQLVKVHGGRIWVDSTWGKGSVFSFSLPRQTQRTDVVTLQSARKIS